MPMDVKQVAKLKSLLAIAKKGYVNFGLSIGAKPEDTVLLMHRTKPGKKLSTDAKELNDGSKLVFGIARLDGRMLHLNCERKPPSGMGVNVKQFFKSIKLSYGVTVRQGTDTLETDEADAEDKPAKPVNKAEAGKWLKTKAALEPALTASLDLLPGAPALRATWTAALASAQKGDYPGAIKAADQLKTSFATALKAHGAAKLTIVLKDMEKVKSSLSVPSRMITLTLAVGPFLLQDGF